MKNFQQNLLIILALALCLLCVWQWYGQTMQRNQIGGLNQLLSQKLAAIQDYTNSIHTLDGQVLQLNARITELKENIKKDSETALQQTRAVNALEVTNRALNLEITEYKSGVEKLDQKIKEAYDGIEKQNDVIKTLTTQRDELVQKLNDNVKDRNNIVTKYNELADRYQKLQGDAKSSGK